MTLNATGPISLGGSTAGQSINLELSQAATAQVSLNDTNVRSLAGVASGAIIMPTNFYSKSSVVIFLNNQSAADFTGGSRTATTGYRLTSAGLTQTLVNTTYTTQATWCTPTSEAINYDVLVNNVTGSGLTTGTVGSWVSLSTTQTWTLVAGIGTSALTTFDVSIRRTGTTTPIYGPATITLESDAA